MSMRIIKRDNVEIAAEAFGDSAHPPVLLIMGEWHPCYGVLRDSAAGSLNTAAL